MEPKDQSTEPNTNSPLPQPSEVITPQPSVQPQVPAQPQPEPQSQPSQPQPVDNLSQNTNPEPAAQQFNNNPQPVQPNSFGPQPIVGNFEPNLPPPSKSNKKKKLFIAAGASLALVLAVSGFVFGYYIPNQPENVYRTGLERSGDAIHEMILQSTDAEKLEQIKKSEFDGSLEVTSDEFNASGNFNAKLDPTKSDSSLDVKYKEKDQQEKSFTLKALTELKEGSRFPNVYLQISGLKALQLDDIAPGFSDYDGKWIVVEADYLESLGAGFLPPEEKKNKENVSAEEVAELIRSISEVNNEYLFSTDPSKAVLENREYLGKEKTEEGIDSFHYKVGVNKDNAVAYCKALSDKVLSSRAVKKFIDADDKQIEEYKKSSIEDCDKSKDDIKQDETFDMWVDSKYKIIHKIRIYEEKDKTDKYTDIGQIYNGGDKLSFFVRYHDDKNNLNVKFTLDVDIKQLNSKAKITASQEGADSFNGSGSIAAKPYDGEINTDKPAGAIPISEILAKFGYDPTYESGISPSGGGSIQSRADDSEIKSDIQAIASQVEVYFADNAVYPTLSQINSKSFRNDKLGGLQDEALKAPGSSDATLGTTPSASQYAYIPSSCTSKRCQKFVLSALLSTGEMHKIEGSNN